MNKFDFRRKHQTLYWEVEKIFGEYKNLKFSDLKKILSQKNIVFEDNILFLVLQNLLVNDGKIVRRDDWNSEPEYVLLDQHYWDSSTSKDYYSVKDKDIDNKAILLIADTHIGDNDFFNSKLLHNIYDYGIMMGVKRCVHLGDLFMGNKFDIKNFAEEFRRQLNIFITEYPNPDPTELMTYCLIGNRDRFMNEFLQNRDWFCSSDLRKLSIYNPSFYMIPGGQWGSKLNGINFHFSHKLFASSMVEDLKICNIEDFKRVEMFLDCLYDVQISGHLHKGIIYTTSDPLEPIDKLFLGVPSTSNLNVGSAIGYLLYMYPESNSMEISILGCNNDFVIYEMNRINWKFNERNKGYRRIL